MRDEPLDSLEAVINEAARRLVADEPSSALRQGVRDRMDAKRSAWSRGPVWAAAAGLVVVVLIVGRTLFGPPDGPDTVRPAGPDKARSTIGDAQRPAPVVAVQPVAPTVIQPEARDARQLSRRIAVPLPLPEEEPLIPPITIEPLVTAPLSAVQIAVNESSGVMPIEIEPLKIEPLPGQ